MEMRPEAYTCTWCGEMLEAPETAWLVKAQTVVDRPGHEGEFVPFKLAKSNRTITAFFVTADPAAKQRKGTEVIFGTCGQECAAALKAAVREEVDNLGLIIS